MNTNSTSDIFLKRLRLFILLVAVFSLFWFGDGIWYILMSYDSVIRYSFFFIALLAIAYFIFFRKESDTLFILSTLSFVQKLFSSDDDENTISTPESSHLDTKETFPNQKLKTSTQKRAVSGYTKRMIASKQEWKCLHCKQMLQASFEVDHILALSDGGGNNEENLVALCRNCHGEKTFLERTKDEIVR
jgi:hypothetical protein